MQIDRELSKFLASPVMIIIGTCDAHGQAEIARGAGACVDAERGTIDLVFSGWQWPATITNLQANGRIAVTFSRPADYVSYQVKGHATLRTPDQNHLVRSDCYLNDMVRLFVELGLPQDLIAPWLTRRDPVVANIALTDVFVQTPGAGAGQRIAAGP